MRAISKLTTAALDIQY